MILADVYINIPIKSISQAYSYIVPDELSYLDVGWRVIVPFGGRSIEGFIVSVRNVDENSIGGEYKLKPIKETLDEEAWFTKEVIEAARWMADFYLCSVGEMMRLFIPGKSGAHIQLAYEAIHGQKDNVLLQVQSYGRVYEALVAAGTAKKKELKDQLVADGNEDIAQELENILEKLLQYNVIKRVYNADNKAKAAFQTVYVPSLQLTEEILEEYSRKPAQKKALLYINDKQQAVAEESKPLIFTAEDFKNKGISAATIKALTEAGMLSKSRQRVFRNSYDSLSVKRKEVELTREQRAAVEAIEEAVAAKKFQEFLLYGVTGSGKTQVYIEAAQKVRKMDRRVVVLVPEIALTGQVVQAFKSYFEEDIIVIHSRLSISERNDAIMRVRRGEAGIIIGARSALFTPADNLGLIIMDEEQDNSYKQDESPRYHARVVAEKLAQIYGAPLLLGSATPSLETYHKAHTGQCTMLRLPYRIGNKPLPEVSCVDMRQELKRGRRNIISYPLRLLIEDTISKGEQMIIMLNRRGFATFVMCRSCGEVIKCPQCTMPLVYHKDKRLMCHHCDITVPVPDVCPKCESRYIKYFGSGTEKLEQELQALVPQARVIRMDRDTTTGKFGHTNIINRFRDKEFDILLGTQMVAKGHDIPNVTAVGIISADSALNMPDFRAAERVFMLITQTAGRAGRGDIPGKVIVQSYSPEHNAVQSGIKQDYQAFYDEEMKLRKSLFFPPFCRIVKLIFQNEQPELARQQAQNLKDNFLDKFGRTAHHQIIGPAPAMIPTFKGVHRFSMLIKTDDLKVVNTFLREQGIHRDMNVIIDIDPITTA
ncbi:Helicase PriA essential for oriC/DnaA-independent DNA replication [Anaerovibrio sp. JC8]|uniref:replication restart helicase PriA n=1 Tax=Anaerovibrio sp. JC8 TaxID=1240085 RepID=UPI000A0C975A|nr:primosomal protein N' [Anaerovibrio sp. JC8]ORT99755.1 Helicase PriA essential for oriC/DnaA-independent DNA replication [Anaerovibrio sp. JC8]